MPSFFKTEKENTSKTRLIDNLKIYSEKTGRNVVIYASNFLNNDSEENYINSFVELPRLCRSRGFLDLFFCSTCLFGVF